MPTCESISLFKEYFVPASVRAEMVASVFVVEVQVGDLVQPGQTLVVLESMKMEIPVLADTDGKVASVSVAVGDVVNEGDILVTFE